MKLTVTKVQVIDSVDKPVEYKIDLVGCSPDALVDAKLTLKSIDKRLLEKLVPTRIGESREMKLTDVNHTLCEFDSIVEGM